MTHVLVHLRKIGAWSKYGRKSGKNVANTIIMMLSAGQDRQARVRIQKQSAYVKFTQELRHCVSESSEEHEEGILSEA